MNASVARIRSSAIAAVLCVAIVSACYHYRAQPPGPAGMGSTDYAGGVVWSFVWGLVQQNPQIDNCQGQALAEVRVTSNFGFALLTVATLGLAAPAKVEWRCAKAQPRGGEIRLPGDSTKPR